jgi:8-oxo-dGTP pyrophosphatase MutT (NUDIX family)
VQPAFDLSSVRARLEAIPAPPSFAGPREAAVAIILAPRGTEDAEVLFIKRAEREGDPWSGHVAFPGGRRDPTDAELLDVALRETREEVGLDLAVQGEVLARLESVHAIARGKRIDMVITPFVFGLREESPRLVPNEEVATTLWVPLGQLARLEGAGKLAYEHEGTPMELPTLKLGEHVLWGLSYRMVMMLIDALR